MAEFKDYYQILGVPRDADADVIRRAYRKLAAKHHPDRNPGDASAEDRFKEINEAYTALSDSEKRRIYDTYGRTGNVPPPGAYGSGGHGSGAPGGAAGGWTHVQGDVGDFSDFFRSLFGAGFSPTSGGGTVRFESGFTGSDFARGGVGSAGPPPPREPARGTLKLELERAYHGGDVTVTAGGRRVTVTVPPGSRDGATLRLRGQAPGGGDLLLTVRHKPHPDLLLEGDDVRSFARVPDHLAALGGSVSVATLDGPVTVTVPAGSSSGRVLRLRGQGWPRKGGGRGDHKVELRVTVPEKLTARQREAYERLREAGGSSDEAAESDRDAQHVSA